MKAKLEKTNAMRKLDAMKIKYNEHTYTDTDAISGVEVAAVLGRTRCLRPWLRKVNPRTIMYSWFRWRRNWI